MAFCGKCGAQVNGPFCPACGASVGAPGYNQAPPPPPSSSSGDGLAENVASALCYLFIPAIIFLVMAPYNQNKNIRFHAFQGIFFSIAYMVIWFGITIGLLMLSFIFSGGFIVSTFARILQLGFFAFWVFLVYKAYNNERFVIPGIGQLAQKQA